MEKQLVPRTPWRFYLANETTKTTRFEHQSVIRAFETTRTCFLEEKWNFAFVILSRSIELISFSRVSRDSKLEDVS